MIVTRLATAQPRIPLHTYQLFYFCFNFQGGGILFFIVEIRIGELRCIICYNHAIRRTIRQILTLIIVFLDYVVWVLRCYRLQANLCSQLIYRYIRLIYYPIVLCRLGDPFLIKLVQFVDGPFGLEFFIRGRIIWILCIQLHFWPCLLCLHRWTVYLGSQIAQRNFLIRATCSRYVEITLLILLLWYFDLGRLASQFLDPLLPTFHFLQL